MPAPPQDNAFGRLLRFWRTALDLSQEELAGRLDVSARHISFLENARTGPSRGFVDRLAASFQLGRRDAGNLLLAAGYLPRFEASTLEAPGNELLRQGLVETLRHLDPYPAAVIDPCANVKMVNRAWVLANTCLFGAAIERPDVNTIRLLVAPDGWRRHVPDWATLACLYLVLLEQEAILRGNLEAAELVREIAADPEIPSDWARRGMLLSGDGHNHIAAVRGPDGEVRRFLNVHHTVGSTGYVSEPRLIIHATFPEDGVPDLPREKLIALDLRHPLLPK